jgi:quercetin dioxygenase-like cupin family protein
MKECQNCNTQCGVQPIGRDFTADGVTVKEMSFAEAFTVVPQHSHCHDHLTLLATGRVRIWADGELLGDRTAPDAIFIKAGVKHAFQTLSPGVVLYCIHNTLRSAGEVEVFEEHVLDLRELHTTVGA